MNIAGKPISIGGGSNIKSVQRGIFTPEPPMGGGEDNTVMINNFTIETVNPDNCVGIAYPIIGRSSLPDFKSTAFVYDNRIQILYPSCANIPSNMKIQWEVIEFDNVKSVQSGGLSPTSNPSNYNIQKVDLSKTLLFYSVLRQYNHTFVSSLGSVRFVSDNEIELNQPSAIFTTDPFKATQFSWHIVEFN